MWAWDNLVLILASFLYTILRAYIWVVIIATLMTWIEPNPYNPVVRFLYAVTEPVFDWVRQHIPVFFGGIDFSPMIVIFAIYFIQGYVIPTVVRLLIGVPPGYGVA
jgi:YggT family protein